MQVIDINGVPVQERPHVREGVFRIQHIAAGEPNTPGNFALMLSSLPDTYYSPRHRHNFDQVRYQIEGDFDFDSDGAMKPGSVAYFPEGTRYGPQSSNTASLTLVLQFGGASGSGYVSPQQYEQAMQELSQKGTFEKGVYTTYKEDGTKVNQDAFEAVWEQVNGKKLVYPEQRYLRPVFMEPDHFHWVGLPDQSGVERKLLGVFSELGTRLAMYRIEQGAGLGLDGNSLFFVIHGTGNVEGNDYARHTTIQTLPDEAMRITAGSETELLQMGLPGFG